MEQSFKSLIAAQATILTDVVFRHRNFCNRQHPHIGLPNTTGSMSVLVDLTSHLTAAFTRLPQISLACSERPLPAGLIRGSTGSKQLRQTDRPVDDQAASLRPPKTWATRIYSDQSFPFLSTRANFCGPRTIKRDPTTRSVHRSTTAVAFFGLNSPNCASTSPMTGTTPDPSPFAPPQREHLPPFHSFCPPQFTFRLPATSVRKFAT